MVLHPKKKSKRQTTRHRTKVARKVREHERKQRKQSKKALNSGGKKRADPGIPTSFPKKDSFLEQLSADRQSEKDYQRKQRLESEKLQILLQDAENRTEIFAKLGKSDPNESVVVSSVQDSSKKAYIREFKQVVEGSDVILEVLDARDPQGCRAEQVEEMVRQAGKKLVLVLNKVDLIPLATVHAWLGHLRRRCPTIAFKASINSQRSGLGKAGGLTANDAMGADQLISLLKNYCRSHDIKTAITVGVVGYPNVGKSSLINSLKRAKVCKVGSTAGVTTVSQQVRLDKNIVLLDSPGIVFSNASNDDSLFLRNVLKVEQLEDPIAPIGSILKRVPKSQLIACFGCSWTGGLEGGDAEDVSGFLRSVALAHGKLKKGGVPNLESAAKYVLNEWNLGKIRYWNEPPATSQDTLVDSCAIVSEMSPEFVFEDGWLGNNDGKEENMMDVDA